MNKTTGIAIGIIAVVVIAGVVYAAMTTKDTSMMKQDTTLQDGMMDQDTTTDASMMEQGEEISMMDDNADMMQDDEVMASSGSYESYSPEKLAMAENGDVVLFFHASWCPSCRGLDTNINNNLSAIPSDTTILKLDYDKETELKKKYGVTYQHTLVQVDANGDMIKKWSGGGTLDALLAQIQ